MNQTGVPPLTPVVRADNDPNGGSYDEEASASVGRTGWDFLTSTLQSKLLLYSIIALITTFIIWLFWDSISALPLYVISSVLLSMLWYNPISRWLSRTCTYIEVWEPDTGLLTTYRVGKQKFAQMQREGLQNQVSSRLGNTRVFATEFYLDDDVLKNTWIHECDPWTYHRDRRTMTRLTNRVSEVFDDIVDGEAIAQVEGRVKAMESMRRHYADLDSMFFGQTEDGGGEQNPVEAT